MVLIYLKYEVVYVIFFYLDCDCNDVMDEVGDCSGGVRKYSAG